ncbi:MAG: hypothetical protein K8Q89_00255 [Nitrosarchaeum sp.]|nr:hypothetical protein [Nitrosarchaeum sp.]
MKYFVIFLILIGAIGIQESFAEEISTLDFHTTQIEDIDGSWYYVSEPVMMGSSDQKVIFQNVTFSLPYTTDPPRRIYSDVIFSDGIKETLSILFDYPDFTEHIDPQAGLVERTDGYYFLVTANLKELSPLKQIKSGIEPENILCRENLELIFKYDNSSACVKSETKIKLIERGYAIQNELLINNTGVHFQNSIVNILNDSSNPESQVQLDPKTITVMLGINNTVTWINEDATPHTLVSNENSTWQTGIILPDKESSVIFNQTGIFEYHGEPHPWISGKVIVLENGNPEPEFKDEKISTIKISKGEIVSAKAIKFNGWTNQPNQEILLTVTAPNGDIISTGKLSSMNNGTFADAITTGGPLWEQQDGIYLVTVQQGDDPTNSAYFELDLKDGNIITGK